MKLRNDALNKLKLPIVIAILLTMGILAGCEAAEPVGANETESLPVTESVETERGNGSGSDTSAEASDSSISKPRDFAWLEDGEFRLSAHRGASAIAPENTIPAIEEAIAYGYGAIEIDPRLSADGKIFIMHDATVERTTNGQGSIEGMSSEEIQALAINTVGYPAYEDAVVSVPTLDAVLDIIEHSDVVLNIDCSKGDWLNEGYIEQVYSALDSHNLVGRTFFVATNTDVRRLILAMHPEVCVSWLYDPANDLDSSIEEVRGYEHALLSISDSNATEDVVDALERSGIYYQVYSVNETNRLLELVGKGVPMVETDNLLPEYVLDEDE